MCVKVGGFASVSLEHQAGRGSYGDNQPTCAFAFQSLGLLHCHSELALCSSLFFFVGVFSCSLSTPRLFQLVAGRIGRPSQRRGNPGQRRRHPGARAVAIEPYRPAAMALKRTAENGLADRLQARFVATPTPVSHKEGSAHSMSPKALRPLEETSEAGFDGFL